MHTSAPLSHVVTLLSSFPLYACSPLSKKLLVCVSPGLRAAQSRSSLTRLLSPLSEATFFRGECLRTLIPRATRSSFIRSTSSVGRRYQFSLSLFRRRLLFFPARDVRRRCSSPYERHQSYSNFNSHAALTRQQLIPRLAFSARRLAPKRRSLLPSPVRLSNLSSP